MTYDWPAAWKSSEALSAYYRQELVKAPKTVSDCFHVIAQWLHDHPDHQMVGCMMGHPEDCNRRCMEVPAFERGEP